MSVERELQELIGELMGSSKFVEAQMNLLESALYTKNYAAIEKARHDAISAFEALIDKKIAAFRKAEKISRKL